MDEKGITTVEDRAIIDELQSRGYVITKNRKKRDATYRAELARFGGKAFRFGVISCTHFGSRYQQLTHLNTFYSLIARRRISLVLHAGDLTDGTHKMHRGMEYEQFLHGYAAHRKYAVENYPRRSGVETWVVSGNHDLSFQKDVGADIVEDVCNARDDMKYLGQWGAYIELPSLDDSARLKVYLGHGSGGVAYARSYKLQKIVEQLAPEKKPHFLFMGHWHTMAHIPQYRNVEAWSLGCFQSQTGYLLSKGLYPTVSGLIVTVYPDHNGIGRVIYENVPFYEMKSEDY